MSNQDMNQAVTSELHERPLVTFALFAYNQEKYIRAAVEGAFAQEYSPLEIILSDDCSTDRTFEIMQELAANYRGPHKVILNRNETNRGLTPHVFGVARLATGTLLIAAAGDDISFPNRTHAIVENWNQTHCSAFTTDEEHYDESGTYMGYCQRHLMACCAIEDFTSVKKSLGCTWGIERDLLLKYPAPPRDMINEDVFLGLIAMLHKGVSYIPAATVKRTTGVGISSNRRFQSRIEEKIVFLTRRAALLKAMIEALRVNNDGVDTLIIEKDFKTIQSLLNYAKTGRSFLNSIACIAMSRQTKYVQEMLKIMLLRLMPS
jgi:hypothetical protein